MIARDAPYRGCMSPLPHPCVSQHACGAWKGTPEHLWVGGERVGVALWWCSGRCYLGPMKLLPRSKAIDSDDLGRCNLGHTRLKVMT